MKRLIEAVFFDLGNTLVDFGANGSLSEKICSCTGLTAEELYPIMHKYLLTKDGDPSEVLRAFIEGIGGNCRKKRLMHVLNSHKVAPRLFDETINTLRELKKQNLFLGIISNTSVLNYISLIKLGLDKFIDLELLSFKIGIAKPDKEIYRVAEKKSQINTSKILFIGDSIRSDLLGAKNAGWHAALLNRKFTELPEFCSKEIVISSLKPLAKMVSCFNKNGKFNWCE